MKRKWLSLIALVMVAVMCTPVIALGGTNIFYVDTANKKSLNMRSDCTMGDNIIASIPYRAEVTVYEFLAGDAWARVEYNGLMGFVMTRYLSGTRPASGGSGGIGGSAVSSGSGGRGGLPGQVIHVGQVVQVLVLVEIGHDYLLSLSSSSTTSASTTSSSEPLEAEPAAPAPAAPAPAAPAAPAASAAPCCA